MYQIRDIMTERPIVIRPEASIDEAISLILDQRVSGLPVVDADGRLLGVISELDIIDLVYKADIQASRVRDHMTRDPLTLTAEDSLDEAARLFCTQSIRRIPVVQQKRLVGIVSRRDLIRFVRDVRQKTAAREQACCAAPPGH